MADDKNRTNQPLKKSSEDPVEGRRDVPRSNSTTPNNKTSVPKQQRKYDVDKALENDYSSDDPTEGRQNATHGSR